MSFYDRGRQPIPDHDPTKEIQFAIDAAVKQLGDGLFRMADAAMEVVKELLKEVVDKIVGFITNPEEMLEDIGEWVLSIPKLIGGLLSATIIPGLDASKIVSGFFNIGQINGLQANLDALDAAIGAIPGAQELIDKICNALGVPGTGHNASDVFNALSNIPGGNIVGAIAASLISGLLSATNIPGLDASKIISGTISQTFLSITSIGASIITGVLGGAQIPTLDASKIGSGVLDKLRFPDITRDMSSDIQDTIDSMLNAANNTNLTGQAVTALEGTWAGLQTAIYNVFGGNSKPRASQSEAADALTTIKDTISQQGNAISLIQGMLEGANGYSALVNFRQPETTVFSTPTATSSGSTDFTYTLPSWFTLSTDWLDGIVAGGGGGGDGTGDIVFQGPGLDGWSSRLIVNGVTREGLFGAGGNNGAGPNPLATGEAMPDLNYLDILYPGAPAGTQPGAGGNAGNATPAGDRHAGSRGQWNAFSVQPTSPTITGRVGDGGAGGNAGFGGFAGKKGGAGRVYVRARPVMPASFTSMGNIATLSGGGGGLVIPLFRLNSGVALTDEMMATAMWGRVPPNTTTGGHVLIIRAHTSFSHYVYLRVWYTGGNTNYEIGRVISGTRAPWKSNTITGAIPFNAFSIQSDNTRIFTILINGIPFDSYSDVLAASSAKGDLYRSGGWGSSDSALPGSIFQFAFQDSGTASRITSSTVSTSQTTSSTSYTDLSTVGPSVTVVVPPSGEVKVDFSVWANHASAGQNLYASIAMSGANTLAANDANAAQIRQMAISPGNLVATLSKAIHMTGLNPGATTFTLKYKTTSGNATFADRHLIVDPRP